ncbi:MAG: hypothetical protein PHG06_23460, partial [Parabacteroides sp.]|nr:hypothetical protein [Parabacteroides sp.]
DVRGYRPIRRMAQRLLFAEHCFNCHGNYYICPRRNIPDSRVIKETCVTDNSNHCLAKSYTNLRKN